MGSMSIMHWAIVAAVVALLFGRNKISGLMEDVAQGIKSFKKGMQDEPVEGSSQTERLLLPTEQTVDQHGQETRTKQPMT